MSIVDTALPRGRQALYLSLRDAGLLDAPPLRNVEWIMQANDGATILNWWRRKIFEKNGWIVALVDARSWESRSKAQEKKRLNVVRCLSSLHGQLIRVVVLESKNNPAAHAGTKFDHAANWLVEDTGTDFLLWRGREPETLTDTIPADPRGYGEVHPNRRALVSSKIERDPKVVRFTLERAGNRCEITECVDHVDFFKPDAHHVESLGSGGSDHTDNTIALCPGCHARVHRGISSVVKKLELRIQQIVNSRRCVSRRGVITDY